MSLNVLCPCLQGKRTNLRKSGSERINHGMRVRFNPLALLLDAGCLTGGRVRPGAEDHLRGETINFTLSNMNLVQRIIYEVRL